MTDYIDSLANKSVGILGLGVSGRACLSYLSQKSKCRLFAIDGQLDQQKRQAYAQQYPQLTLTDFAQGQPLLCEADLLIISPGIALAHPELAGAIEQGVEIIGDVELFARVNKRPVIGITGSNGKTTVTHLVTQMLKDGGYHAVYGGNVGIAVTELLEQSFDVAVLELSSFQLETTQSLGCETATILNVVEDHMDRYQGFDDYRRAKHQIYRQSRHIVANRDDSHTQADMAGSSFGLGLPEYIGDIGIQEGVIIRRHSAGVDKICAVDSLAMIGTHNVANAMAAIALVAPFKLDDQQIAKTLASFSGLEHRCELISSSQAVRWVNDSKATNVGATLAALTSIRSLCHGQLVLIAGGASKDADLGELRQSMNNKVDALITLGQDGEQIAELFSGQVERVASLKQAVAVANDITQGGDWVLLSPACASFDMFKDYQDRGKQFKAFVKEVNSDS